MSITYQETADGINPSDLQGFFAEWPNRPSPEGHLKILQGSNLLVLALSKTCRVVGFITAITDGVSCAYISYLEVLPEWQNRGIGTELMTRMMEKLKPFYAIDLICDEDVKGFYETVGFTERCGMTIRNYESQAL